MSPLSRRDFLGATAASAAAHRYIDAVLVEAEGRNLPPATEALEYKTLMMVRRYAHLSEQHTPPGVRRMVEGFLA